MLAKISHVCERGNLSHSTTTLQVDGITVTMETTVKNHLEHRTDVGEITCKLSDLHEITSMEYGWGPRMGNIGIWAIPQVAGKLLLPGSENPWSFCVQGMEDKVP